MSQTSKWAPVVYSRTNHVDFRFLALPQDVLEFGTSEQILTGIRPLLGTPAELRSRPAWAVFMTATHCVFGVAAYISDIADGPLEPDITHVGVRQTYAFAGWATPLGGAVQLPLYEQLALAPARPHLAFVQSQWEDREFNKHVDTTQYDSEFPVAAAGTAEAWPAKSDGLTLWPVTRSRDLWNAAAGALRHARTRPVLLCIDLPNAHDAYGSPYAQVTARDVSEVTVYHTPDAEPPQAPPPRSTSTRREHPAFDSFDEPVSRAGDRSGSAIRTGALIATTLTACALVVWQRWLLLVIALAGGALLLGRHHARRADASTQDDADDPLIRRRRAARAEPKHERSAWD